MEVGAPVGKKLLKNPQVLAQVRKVSVQVQDLDQVLDLVRDQDVKMRMMPWDVEELIWKLRVILKQLIIFT